jgi:hypothetical protein
MCPVQQVFSTSDFSDNEKQRHTRSTFLPQVENPEIIRNPLLSRTKEGGRQEGDEKGKKKLS